jgi:SanA protein
MAVDKKIRKKRWRRTIYSLLIGAGLFAGFVLYANQSVIASSRGHIYTDTSAIPKNRVALVLGTAPKLADGHNNLYFVHRIAAAAKLYQAGKVEKILVSGDNSRATYDEPTAMKQALIEKGVPAEAVVIDYAGFHTLDSIVRAHKVFGLTSLTIITDDFHLPRALYIAGHEGLDAVGFQTEPLPASVSPQTWVREVGSRALMFVDLYVTHRSAKFLGPHETI